MGLCPAVEGVPHKASQMGWVWSGSFRRRWESAVCVSACVCSYEYVHVGRCGGCFRLVGEQCFWRFSVSKGVCCLQVTRIPGVGVGRVLNRGTCETAGVRGHQALGDLTMSGEFGLYLRTQRGQS